MLPAGQYVEVDSREFLAPSFKEHAETWVALVAAGAGDAEEARAAVLHTATTDHRWKTFSLRQAQGPAPRSSHRRSFELRPTSAASYVLDGTGVAGLLRGLAHSASIVAGSSRGTAMLRCRREAVVRRRCQPSRLICGCSEVISALPLELWNRVHAVDSGSATWRLHAVHRAVSVSVCSIFIYMQSSTLPIVQCQVVTIHQGRE